MPDATAAFAARSVSAPRRTQTRRSRNETTTRSPVAFAAFALARAHSRLSAGDLKTTSALSSMSEYFTGNGASLPCAIAVLVMQERARPAKAARRRAPRRMMDAARPAAPFDAAGHLPPSINEL